MLFNEPKLLKFGALAASTVIILTCFSALQRAEIAEIPGTRCDPARDRRSFSALQRAEIAEIQTGVSFFPPKNEVSVLFNEPKLLKLFPYVGGKYLVARFSALQRAEIAEIVRRAAAQTARRGFSALQRAEIAEMYTRVGAFEMSTVRFSALQRAEIAEITNRPNPRASPARFQCSSTSRNC